MSWKNDPAFAAKSRSDSGVQGVRALDQARSHRGPHLFGARPALRQRARQPHQREHRLLFVQRNPCSRQPASYLYGNGGHSRIEDPRSCVKHVPHRPLIALVEHAHADDRTLLTLPDSTWGRAISV